MQDTPTIIPAAETTQRVHAALELRGTKEASEADEAFEVIVTALNAQLASNAPDDEGMLNLTTIVPTYDLAQRVTQALTDAGYHWSSVERHTGAVRNLTTFRIRF